MRSLQYLSWTNCCCVISSISSLRRCTHEGKVTFTHKRHLPGHPQKGKTPGCCWRGSALDTAMLFGKSVVEIFMSFQELGHRRNSLPLPENGISKENQLKFALNQISAFLSFLPFPYEQRATQIHCRSFSQHHLSAPLAGEPGALDDIDDRHRQP